MRINRYIMECKSNNYTSVTNSDIELIDTLWNVNFPVNASVLEVTKN